MANSPQLDKSGLLIGFIWLHFLKKTQKPAEKSETYVKNYRINSPKFLFLRPFQYPVIFLLWNIKKVCAPSLKNLQKFVNERKWALDATL